MRVCTLATSDKHLIASFSYYALSTNKYKLARKWLFFLSLINLRFQRLTRTRSGIRSFDQVGLLRGLETGVKTAIDAPAFFDDEVHTVKRLADWTERWKANIDESLHASDIGQTSHPTNTSWRESGCFFELGNYLCLARKGIATTVWRLRNSPYLWQSDD